MARIIGYVKAVENGTFFVKDIHGNIRQLKAGDVISEGELVYGDQTNVKTAKIIIDMANAGSADITLAGNSALNFDTSLLKSIFLSDDAVIHTDSLKSALNIVDPALIDNKNNDNETAAGNEVVMSENSTSVVFSDRTGTVKDVTTLLDLTAINLDQPKETIETFRPVVIDTSATAGTLTISTIAGDDIINATEAGQTNTAISGMATGGDIKIGDTVTLTVNGHNYTTTVQTGGTYSVNVLTADLVADNNIDVKVTSYDTAGNSIDTMAVRSVTVDTAAPVIANQTFDYAENTAAGATIATVVASDNVAVIGYSFKATGTIISADGFYQIDNSGVITLTAAGAASTANDFENAPNSGDYVITVKDAANNATDATITLRENNVDDASVMAPDNKTVTEDTVVSGNVLTNDSDVDSILSIASFKIAGDSTVYTAGQTATITGVGTLSLAVNGDYIFIPAANYNGTVPQATYTVNTGSTSTFDVTVDAVNDVTTVKNDTATTNEDAAVIIDVIANDTDVDA
ncbi:MAG: Ig-like domain-containing protein, partial [Sulfuricurvum sp.]|nr:Ig-like domain-containing protein [Sulfuricurvum sp.]